MGIILSRWLIGPLGPWINVTGGLSGYPWRRFIVVDVAGEVQWLLIYVSLGRMFSHQVQALTDIAGNLTWVIVGLLAAGLIGRMLFRRTDPDTSAERGETGGLITLTRSVRLKQRKKRVLRQKCVSRLRSKKRSGQDVA